jgi:hypothetical protein
LELIKAGVSLEGVEPGLVVTVAAVVPVGDSALTVFYKLPDGTLRERLLGRADEPEIALATTARPWSFDGDGEAFKLTAEAKRIDLAFLFDPMMAVHASNVEPLPHQITAVYESMLPRQPLRYVLADDPGAGKTIMAGLYIRELIMRERRPSTTRSTSRSQRMIRLSPTLVGWVAASMLIPRAPRAPVAP